MYICIRRRKGIDAFVRSSYVSTLCPVVICPLSLAMYIYIYIYTLVHTCIHIYIYICIHTYVYMYICIYVYIYIEREIYIYLSLSIYIYIYRERERGRDSHPRPSSSRAAARTPSSGKFIWYRPNPFLEKERPCIESKCIYMVQHKMASLTMFGYMYSTCTFFFPTCSDQVHTNLPY